MKKRDRHASPFYQKILQFIKKKGLISPGEKVVLAVSGGVDSVVLIDMMARLQDVLKTELVIAHVNHQLRGKESNGDERFVQQLAKRYNIQCFVERAATKKIVNEKKRSLQDVAREIRYSFFDTLKKSLKANRIATAHNANDNAETVLMNLFRGSGIDGLQGIPLRRDTVIRPLLCVTRKEISSYAKERKLSFREDSSNRKDDYTRNYLRHNIIPKLEKRINPSLVESLLRESEIVAANVEFVDELVENSYDFVVQNNEIIIHQAKSLHPFLLQMMIRRLFVENNIEPSFDSIGAVIDLSRLIDGFLMLQDWDFQGAGVPVPVIAELFDQIPCFKSMKIEVAFAGPKYSAVMKACGNKIHVAGGWAANQMIEGLDRGVHAFMPTVLHRIYKCIFDLHRQGKRDAAVALFNKFLPVLSFTRQHLEVAIRFNKQLLVRQGVFRTENTRTMTTPFDTFLSRLANELIGYGLDLYNSIPLNDLHLT